MAVAHMLLSQNSLGILSHFPFPACCHVSGQCCIRLCQLNAVCTSASKYRWCCSLGACSMALPRSFPLIVCHADHMAKTTASCILHREPCQNPHALTGRKRERGGATLCERLQKLTSILMLPCPALRHGRRRVTAAFDVHTAQSIGDCGMHAASGRNLSLSATAWEGLQLGLCDWSLSLLSPYKWQAYLLSPKTRKPIIFTHMAKQQMNTHWYPISVWC